MGKATTGMFLRVIIIAVLCLIVNSVIYTFQPPHVVQLKDMFVYPLWAGYLFFLLFSLLILFVLVKVKDKNPAQLGYAFLILTTLKLGITYIFARKIITSLNTGSVEKGNFFAIFILFLAIEVYYTARLLNNKQ